VTALPAAAEEKARNVLVLYSNSRLLPANVEVERGLRDAIPANGAQRIEVFDEFLDTPRFGGDQYIHAMESYLREKYAKRPPDVIVAVSDEALRFMMKARTDDLYPHVPVIHAAVFMSALRSMTPLPTGITGVPIELEHFATIEQVLRWQPEARRVVIVTGASPQDREWEQQIRNGADRFRGRATFEFLAGLPNSVVLERVHTLRSDSVVYTTGYLQDGDRRNFIPRETVEGIAAASSVPVYGSFDTFIGTGIVGGVMPSFEGIGRQAGQSALAQIEGTAADSLPLAERMPAAVHVDWRQVQRWGIDEHAIPADAVVHFRQPAFLDLYRNEVIIALAVLLLQFTLIAGLVIERGRRRIAERNEHGLRFELAHASRLAIAGELTASIAHEINQPLGAILNNADAADLILESGSDRHAEVRIILADIRRDDVRASEVIRRLRSLFTRKAVERQPFDFNEAVRDIEGILRVEAARRRVTVEVRTPPNNATMVGDRIQIQQVLLNLVLNAMDAVAGSPEERRTVVVAVESVNGRIDLEVRDRGCGITAEQLPKLFDSFFSTKRTGMGLGLSIARTLVEAHGGRICAESVPGDGAVFRVAFPAAGGVLPRET
jgi:signal transduction histidine kinase